MVETSQAARLTQGSIMRHLLRMTFPMVIGLLAIISMSLADTWFVSRLGEEYLSAISFTFPIAMFVLSLGIGLSAGTASLVAQALGAGDLARTRRMTLSALFICFLFVLALTLLGIFTIDPLFTLLGASKEELPIIRDYMIIWYPSMIVLIVPMAANSILRSAGDAKWPGLSMLAAAIINFILDPILIFGLFGAPEMGVKGAALSSLLGNTASLIISLIILAYKEKLLTSESKPSFASFLNHSKAILAIGLPASIAQMIGPVSSSIVTAILARIDQGAVAAFGVATRVEGLAMVIIFAMTGIINSMSAQNYGANKIDRVQETLKCGFQICFITGLTTAILLFIFARPIALLFTESEDIVDLTVAYFRLVPISYLAYGMIITLAALFNGMGKPKIGLYLSFFQRIFFLLLFTAIATIILDLGAQGVFASITLSSVLIAFYAGLKGKSLVHQYTIAR